MMAALCVYVQIGRAAKIMYLKICIKSVEFYGTPYGFVLKF